MSKKPGIYLSRVDLLNALVEDVSRNGFEVSQYLTGLIQRIDKGELSLDWAPLEQSPRERYKELSSMTKEERRDWLEGSWINTEPEEDPPAPLSEFPPLGTTYYYVSPFRDGQLYEDVWDGQEADKSLFKHGGIWTDKEKAQKNLDVLSSPKEESPLARALRKARNPNE